MEHRYCKKKLGSRMLIIYFTNYKTSCNRHIDQVRKYSSTNSDIGNSSSGGSSDIDRPAVCRQQLPPVTDAPPSTQSPPPESPIQVPATPPPASPPRPSASAAGEDEVLVATDRAGTTDNSTSNVEEQGHVDDDEWAEASDLTEGQPQPVESVDSNPSTVNTTPAGRSKRLRNPVNYRNYF